MADMVFGFGRYSLAVADIIAADMVCGRYGRTPMVTAMSGYCDLNNHSIFLCTSL